MRAEIEGSPVVVWGARGIIGRALVEDLLARGARVRIVTRRADWPVPRWGDAVEWLALEGAAHGDLFAQALDGASTVFNLAGSSGAVASNRNPLE
ncbi:MAG TPA: NAD-dependent epimerase/dehydratase family protein, partial [Vicinamibacterales bacterium]